VKNQFNFGKNLKNSTIVSDIKIWNCGNETNCGSAFSIETPSLLKMILLCGSVILLFLLILVSLVLGILYVRRQARKDPSKTNNKQNVTDIHLVPTYEASANPKYYTVENYVNEHLYASKQGCLNEAYSQMSTASERSVASSLQSLQVALTLLLQGIA
jgi:Na+-transporting methylmalonyl-CoA/oxaloacetate decarboxylase gamma subunit